MSDKYFKAREEFEWKRNPQWPGIPQDDGNENKIYLVYAVIEDNPNEIGLRTTGNNVDEYIDWGDGTVDGPIGPSFQIVYHTYDYTTVTGPILQLEDGRNYKPVLIECKLALGPYYLFYIWFNNTSSHSGSNNILELVSYLGDGVTTSGPNETRIVNSSYTRSVLMEHFKVKTPNNNYLDEMFWYCKSLKKIELPNNYFHSGISTLQNFGRAASFYGHDFGDIEVVEVLQMEYSDSFKIGNLTIDASETNVNSMCIHSNNYSIGNFTATGATTTVYTFGGTVNNGCGSIGLIDTPALENASYMFRRSQMPEVVFTDCSNITTTTSMFYQCYAIQKLIMPGLIIGVDVNDSNLTADAIDDFFTSVGTASGAQTLDVSDNPGSSTCDTTIATAKGWTVIT